MAEKTLGQVAYEQFWGASKWACLMQKYRDSWQAVADAVMAAGEARRWRPIETLPVDRKQVIIGYRCEGLGWVQTFWFTGTEFTSPVEYTHWTEAPAPPKEAEHG